MRVIENMALEVDLPNAKEIHEAISDEFAKTKLRVPSLRTVQEIVREFRPPNPSGPWRVSDTDPDEARLVLEVLGAQLAEGRAKGREDTPVTNDEADWFVRLCKAAPDMPRRMVPPLTLLYRSREARNGPTRDLDAFLALKPWEDRNRYIRLVVREVVTAVPALDAIIGYPAAMEIAYLRWQIAERVDPLGPRSVVELELALIQKKMAEAGERDWIAELQRSLAEGFGADARPEHDGQAQGSDDGVREGNNDGEA